MRREPVVQSLAAALVAPYPPEVEAHLEYVAADPYAVRLVLGTRCALNEPPVTWVFARQLLLDGLDTVAGLGDVRVWPRTPERTALELRSADCCAVVDIETAGIRAFLGRSLRRVPSGAEGRLIDWQAVVAELLGRRA
ncbi:SsgA family sporulation/cell division regulator [Kitasatospora albolonga]|uniref:SsgA family sporulation/cell division regulator n=1 Tax=Kitasatospora albolonga TaxID=68173 RepID=UPI0031E768B9